MMRAEGEEKNDRDGNADQPKQDGAHDDLSFARSGSQNERKPERFRYELFRESGGPGFGTLLAPAEQRGAQHHGRGVEHDHDHQPAQHLDGH